MSIEQVKDKEYYESEIRRLKEIIGSYRRELQGKRIRREFYKAGYDSDRYFYYQVHIWKGIPPDLEITEVVKFFKEWVTTEKSDFRFQRCDFSPMHKGWLVQICQERYL